MYAIGSRQELEALTKQLAANVKVAKALVEDGKLEQAADMLDLNALFLGMLQQALTDHFVGRN